MAETASEVNGLGALFGRQPQYVAHTPWRPAPALAVTFLVCLIPIALFFLGMIVVLLMGGSAAEVHQWGDAMASLATPQGIGITALSQVLAVAAIWIAAGHGGSRAAVLRLERPWPSWQTCVIGGLVLVAGVGAIELVLYAFADFDPFADSRWLLEGLNSPYWWGTVLIALVLAPLWEEMAFRGFLLSALAQTPLGFWPAAVISGALWTLLHWGYTWPGMVSVFSAGLGLSWLVWRTGSLKAAVVAHGLANAAALAFTTLFAPQF